jgi:hypothetical protein
MEARPTISRGIRVPPIAAVLGMAALSLAFYLFQNRGDRLGGPISPWKAVWLGYAITVFLVVPFYLGWRAAGSAGLRQAWRVLFWVFAARGAGEMVLLTTSRLWACNLGIGHDLLCILVAVALRHRLWTGGPEDRGLRWFLPLYVATLGAEIGNAWTFSRLADPAHGIYFASADLHFQRANLETAAWILLLVPAFGAWLVATRKTFAP